MHCDTPRKIKTLNHVLLPLIDKLIGSNYRKNIMLNNLKMYVDVY